MSSLRFRLTAQTALGATLLLAPLPVHAAAKKQTGTQSAPRSPSGTASSGVVSKGTASTPIRVAVRVVDVADDIAYIEPGAAEELREGDKVVFNGKAFAIKAVSSSHAVFALAGAKLGVGARGTATALTNRGLDTARPLPPPTELSQFQREWSRAVLPASTQHPKPIPLGVAQEQTRQRVRFQSVGIATIPRGQGQGYLKGLLRGTLHYEPISDLPLSLDLDAALQGYVAPDLDRRDGQDSRPVLLVRELSGSYGERRTARAALGRLRYASAILGQLDGARAEAALHEDFTLMAFGGTAPEALSDVPALDVVRFGTELVWQPADSEERPRLVVGGHASRFNAQFDERKLYALFDALPGFGRVGAHGELSFFDQDNPWNAQTSELTALGVDTHVAADAFHFGARFELRRPDRSLWLAQFLPPEWLCRLDPTAPQPNTCIPGDTTYWLGADAGVSNQKVSATIGVQANTTPAADSSNVSSFANLRWLDIAGRLRADTGVTVANGSLVRTVGLSVIPGFTFLQDTLDLSLHYRPAIVRYRADGSGFLEHTFGGSLWYSASPSFDIALDGDAIEGRDVKALIVQALASWRWSR